MYNLPTLHLNTKEKKENPYEFSKKSFGGARI